MAFVVVTQLSIEMLFSQVLFMTAFFQSYETNNKMTTYRQYVEKFCEYGYTSRIISNGISGRATMNDCNSNGFPIDKDGEWIKVEQRLSCGYFRLK